MITRKGLTSIATALLALGSTAWAGDSVSQDSSANPGLISATALVPQPIFADDAASTSPPLMMGLEKLGVGKKLEDWGIAIGGYAEVGYLYDMTVPRDTTPAKVAPGDLIAFPGAYKNSFIPDQFDLNVSRAIDATKGKWDVGFMVEGNYGRDATYFHSNGILDNTVKHGTGGFAQPDLEQAFLTVAVPVGGGLKITAGKFVTLLGDEVINPSGNAFYTHSYAFSYGVPLTQTGLLATYYLNAQWNVTAGITRGWNQSSLDNNGDPDFLGQIAYTGDKLSMILNLSTGPEIAADNTDNVFVPDLILAYKMSDQLTVTGEFLWGYANAISQWYGVVGYANYVFSSQLALNLRAELYEDGSGATTATNAGHAVNFYEVTAGVKITPMPNDAILKNLSIRPELRYDMADHSVLDGTHPTQLTAAIDAIMVF